MGLVHDDGAVVVQVRLSQRLPQQDAVRHVLDEGLLQHNHNHCGRLTLRIWQPDVLKYKVNGTNCNLVEVFLKVNTFNCSQIVHHDTV